MHRMIVQPGTDAASEEEVAAALAAVSMVLAEEGQTSAGAPEATPSGWQTSTRLMIQGLTPWRTPMAARWATIERIRRSGRGGGGVVGM